MARAEDVRCPCSCRLRVLISSYVSCQNCLDSPDQCMSEQRRDSSCTPAPLPQQLSPCAAQVISTARTCNLILIVLDCLKPISHKRLIEHELEGFGIRLNKEPPGITFRKKEKGGISLTTTVTNPKLDLDGASSGPAYLKE